MTSHHSSPALSRRSFLGAAGAVGAGWAASAAVSPPAGAADGPEVVVAADGAASVVVVPRALPPAPAPIDVEAESGTVTAPMRVVADGAAGASGGAYVDSPPDGPPNTGQVSYAIDVPAAGDYTLSARVWGLDGSSDSFYVSVDGGTEIVWSSTKISSTWAWHAVGPGSGSTATVFTLAAGPHTVVFRVREAGARLDQLRLSPAGGAIQAQIDNAVATLVDYVRQSTGVELPVRQPADPIGEDLPSGRLYVGWAGPGADPGIAAALDGLDVDGYVIASHGATLAIVGPSDWGTRFGVYEFLERHVGVRWLMPGPDGADVPGHARIAVPVGRHVDEPDFKGRSYSPLFLSFNAAGLGPNVPIWTSTDPQVQWATFNRTRQRTTKGGNHNLFNIFPPRLYADPSKPETFHPEYYPIIDGETALPKLTATSGWQPRFDTQATVDVAVAYALQYFADNPDLDLLSLSVNDGRGFSETDADPDDLNSLGYPNASESYYAWVNAVVDGVLAARPDYADKIFPVLAYDYVAEPPSFALRDQAVPMITRESHTWSDPALRPHLQAQFTAWADKCREIIWYDYPSGARYIAPRMYLHDMAAAYRWAHQHKVNYQYADMYPDLVGEGPKTWVYSRLLWDVEADVDALADEWCARVAGTAGGPFLRAYFDFWERFWTGPALDSPFWAYGGDRTYVAFTLCTYLDGVSATDIARCRGYLETARAKASTKAQRARVDLILRRFSYLEASVRSYPAPVARPTGAADVLALAHDIDRNLDGRVAAAAERLALGHQLEADPVLRGRYNHDSYHFWTGYDGDAFFRLVDYLAEGRPGAVRLRGLLERIGNSTSAPNASRVAQMALRVADGRIASVTPDGDFTRLDSWDTRGNVELAAGVGRNGSSGIRINSTPGVPLQAVEDDVIQPIPITPGLVAARLWFRATPGDVGRGVMALKYHWWTAANANIVQCVQALRYVAQGQPDWSWIAVMEDVPAEAFGKDVGKLRLVASLLAYDGDAEVRWDDFEVFSENG